MSRLKIEYPKLPELPWPITVRAVQARAGFLRTAQAELDKIQKRINVDRKHVQNICPQHQWPSDCRDPGGGGGFCKVCDKANPR